MSIPKWRVVEYTDDGCQAFQCLNCYKQWEARSIPGYTTVEGQFVALWNFCPCCGIKWEGTARERSDEFGPRKTRIREAVEAYRYENWDRFYAKKEPRFWWVFEQKYIIQRFSFPEKWEAAYRIRGGVDAKIVLEKYRETVEEWKRDRLDGDNFESRIVLVKDLNKTYDGFNKGIEIYI